MHTTLASSTRGARVASRGDGAGFASWERGAAFASPAEGGGAGRTMSPLRRVRFCASTNLTAKPSGKSRTTRPTRAPTASGIPIRGCSAAETATPGTPRLVRSRGTGLVQRAKLRGLHYGAYQLGSVYLPPTARLRRRCLRNRLLRMGASPRREGCPHHRIRDFTGGCPRRGFLL